MKLKQLKNAILKFPHVIVNIQQQFSHVIVIIQHLQFDIQHNVWGWVYFSYNPEKLFGISKYLYSSCIIGFTGTLATLVYLLNSKLSFFLSKYTPPSRRWRTKTCGCPNSWKETIPELKLRWSPGMTKRNSAGSIPMYILPFLLSDNLWFEDVFKLHDCFTERLFMNEIFTTGIKWQN